MILNSNNSEYSNLIKKEEKMRKVGIITRVLIFLRILKKKSELDAQLEREAKRFPFEELIGLEVKCGEKTFTITGEMEKTSSKAQGLGKFGMGFHWWLVKCPFCYPKHDFRIGSDLSVEKVSWTKTAS
jgi:hypothetical protein